ncbi:molybdenum cofactor biosynthesis protein MoaE [Agrilactobacillus yilanensis]|uniref:Molybdenum cofactor biosynthesis protein MoaE n=1 Tax=Agrilactobacillus yilanensis TaxID=2485997 RepID=A0ABW4J6J7_9LACO|nr:molybdenum cofactor biosynthesis protein MoaE [Agrilactobacillus yilanensis]
MAIIDLIQGPINVEALNKQLVDPKYGGIVTFVGTVRQWTDGIQTESINYTAYEEMALKQMHELAQTVEDTGSRVIMVHRLGHLELTDAAVYVGVASEHRSTAFGQCQMLMDQIKYKVPIWKEEIDTDKVRWGGIQDDKH